MTSHRTVPSGPAGSADSGGPGAPGVPAAEEAAQDGTAEVLEIYPGARQDPPVQGGHPPVRRRMKFPGSETGMATAEYAIATLAAVSFAGLLVLIMRSDEVRGFLLNLIRTALALP